MEQQTKRCQSWLKQSYEVFFFDPRIKRSRLAKPLYQKFNTFLALALFQNMLDSKHIIFFKDFLELFFVKSSFQQLSLQIFDFVIRRIVLEYLSDLKQFVCPFRQESFAKAHSCHGQSNLIAYFKFWFS